MNVLFLGEGKLAYTCLNVLFNDEFSKKYDLKSIVSSDTFYKNLSNNCDAQISFISNHLRNEDLIIQEIDRLEIEVLISVQHKWVLSGQVLNKLNGNAFNLHNAKLPDYKGYNSISHAIYLKESNYFVTIHKIEIEVDTGGIALETEIEMSPDETALSLYRKTIPASEALFKNFLISLEVGSLAFKTQRGTGKFYDKNGLDEMRLLKFSDGEEKLDRKVRALYFPPYEPAYFVINDKKIYCLPNNPDANTWLGESPLNKSNWDKA
jgi:methionyl-tRNA formyltransferase